ncbi:MULTISPECIES: hypothetical protein [Antarcticibacterium]|uniref:hypothetical protein n=1 Tax=Antarcticibacterium TaxID=2058174 RepID=UPI001FE74088|nr:MULTISPECIES: hypothetical protein [Antarcticibacterium]
MKKLIYLTFLAIGMTGCSVESLDSTDNLVTADMRAGVKSNVVESFNVPELICAGEEATFSITAAIKTNLQVQEYYPATEEWVQIFQAGQSASENESFTRTWNEPGSYLLKYKIGGGGFTEIWIEVENCQQTCTYGMGYWRNHGPNSPGGQENMYPVGSLEIAGTSYSQVELEEILKASGNVGRLALMKKHLIAVLLNIANGVDGTSILSTIEDAENAISENISDNNQINAIKDLLESFNKENACEDDEEYEEE